MGLLVGWALLQSRPKLVFGIPENLARWADLIYVVLGGYALLLLLWGISFRRLETGWLLSTYWLVYLVGGALIWEFSLRWNLV